MANDGDSGASADHLDREVAIKATADATGVQFSAKSRLVASIDRLCGSIFDWATAPFEGKAAKRRLKDKLDRELLEAAHQIELRRLEAPGRSGQPIEGEIFLEANKEAGTRQLNRFGVAVEAIEALKALPPPEAQEQAGASDSADGAERPTLDEDWMNSFARFAEDASSEQLQALWGRVLAGEIRQPGKFSKRTLRFVSELDQQTAEDCEALAQRVTGKFIYKSDDPDAYQETALALRLEELGLINGAAGTLSQSVTLDSSGRGGVPGRKFGLMLFGTAGQRKAFSVLAVTRLGAEVFSLLPEPNEEELLLEVVNGINKAGLSRIELGTLDYSPEGLRGLSKSRTVWSSLT